MNKKKDSRFSLRITNALWASTRGKAERKIYRGKEEKTMWRSDGKEFKSFILYFSGRMEQRAWKVPCGSLCYDHNQLTPYFKYLTPSFWKYHPLFTTRDRVKNYHKLFKFKVAVCEEKIPQLTHPVHMYVKMRLTV